MAPKAFNNIILGQFVLTGVPIKVYVSGRFLTLTDADDIVVMKLLQIKYQKMKSQKMAKKMKKKEEKLLDHQCQIIITQEEKI